MHRLLLLVVVAVFSVALPLRAQGPAPAAPDSGTRAVVVAGIVRALHDELALAVIDTSHRPWVLFAGDSAGGWAVERAGLARLLRARGPAAVDRYVAVLPVPDVAVTRDSVRARFSVVAYERCVSGWTAGGTDYEWAALRAPTWRVEGPTVVRLWDGPTCTDLARSPGMSVVPPFVDSGPGSVPPAP